MAGILLLNRSFNLIRGLRGAGWLFAALYMLMQGATGAAGQFTGGSLLVLVAIASFFLLYSVYQRPDMAGECFWCLSCWAPARLSTMVSYPI